MTLFWFKNFISITTRNIDFMEVVCYGKPMYEFQKCLQQNKLMLQHNLSNNWSIIVYEIYNNINNEPSLMKTAVLEFSRSIGVSLIEINIT